MLRAWTTENDFRKINVVQLGLLDPTGHNVQCMVLHINNKKKRIRSNIICFFLQDVRRNFSWLCQPARNLHHRSRIHRWIKVIVDGHRLETTHWSQIHHEMSLLGWISLYYIKSDHLLHCNNNNNNNNVHLSCTHQCPEHSHDTC